jgi:hypothetical protein
VSFRSKLQQTQPVRLMFPYATVPYPIQDEVEPDEDGVGFVLRMATVNGITFNQLARKLASPGHLYLPAVASSALAFMFGCSPIRLEQAFVKPYFRGDISQGAAFLGHQFLRPYLLKQAHPQLCPGCLAETQRAHAAWSVALVTCCPDHRVKLIDRCMCGRRVSWRRPSYLVPSWASSLPPKTTG